MKKLLMVSMLACLATAVFAFDLSAGGGLTVGGFVQTKSYEDGYLFSDLWREVSTTVPFGFSAYFDAMYGVAALGFKANGTIYNKRTTVYGSTESQTDLPDDEFNAGFLSFSLLGKYPFTLGPLSLFPLVGIEYDLILYYKDETGSDLDKSGQSQFWFKGGVGADIGLYKGLYLRPQVLLGYKLLNADEKQAIENAISAGATTARITDFVFEGGVQAGWRF